MAYLGDFGGAYFGHWFGRLVEQAESLLRGDQVFVTTLRREIYANPQESRVDVLLRTMAQFVTTDEDAVAIHPTGKTIASSRPCVMYQERAEVVLAPQEIAVLECLLDRYVFSIQVTQVVVTTETPSAAFATEALAVSYTGQ